MAQREPVQAPPRGSGATSLENAAPLASPQAALAVVMEVRERAAAERESQQARTVPERLLSFAWRSRGRWQRLAISATPAVLVGLAVIVVAVVLP